MARLSACRSSVWSMFSRLRSLWRSSRICEWQWTFFGLKLNFDFLQQRFFFLPLFNSNRPVYLSTSSIALSSCHILLFVIPFPSLGFFTPISSPLHLVFMLTLSWPSQLWLKYSLLHSHPLSLSQVSGDGADGCQPVPGDPHGPGPRENVLPALPDSLWHQAPALRWDHPQGKCKLSLCRGLQGFQGFTRFLTQWSRSFSPTSFLCKAGINVSCFHIFLEFYRFSVSSGSEAQ